MTPTLSSLSPPGGRHHSSMSALRIRPSISPSLARVTSHSVWSRRATVAAVVRTRGKHVDSEINTTQTVCDAELSPMASDQMKSKSCHQEVGIVQLALKSTAVALMAASVIDSPAFADTVSSVNPALSDLSALIIPGIVGDSPLREGIVSGFLLIFFSEIGDKTFFIALLLALRQPKTAIFVGTFGALAVMTVISVGLGQVLHQLDELVPQSAAAVKIPYDDLIAASLLVWFGFQTLKDAKDAAESAEEEKEEAQEVVDGFGADDTTKLILTTFALVFAAEWGDKSFLATIALAASSSPLGVVTGAIAGHGVATGLAVAGGSLLSKYFSPILLQYFGGSLFLVFAAATIVDIFAQLNPS